MKIGWQRFLPAEIIKKCEEGIYVSVGILLSRPVRAGQTEHADPCTGLSLMQCKCLGVEVEVNGDVTEDLFVGRNDASHAIHGVDDLCGFVTHSGGILPDDCF